MTNKQLSMLIDRLEKSHNISLRSFKRYAVAPDNSTASADFDRSQRRHQQFLQEIETLRAAVLVPENVRSVA